MLTLKKLSDQVMDVDAAVQAWNRTPNPALAVEFRGQSKQAMSEELVEMFDDLFRSVAVADVEELAKAVILAIDECEDRQNEWAEACQIDPEMTDPSGTRDMWAAWDEVLEQLRIAVTPLPQPEPIKTLKIEKVGDRQICEIYGWVDAQGNPQLHKVREELESPGTHYDPEKWVHPSSKRRMNEASQRWDNRKRSSYDQSTPAGSVEAPESVEELIVQKVPSKQIAMMKRMSVEEVKAIAEAMGVPLDGQYVPVRNPIDQMQRMREEEADRNAQAQAEMQGTRPKTVSERVAELVAAGKNPEQIADQLLGEFPKLKPNQLQKLIENGLQTTGV